MNSKERLLLEQIKDYAIIQGDVDKLRESLAVAGYKMTASYSLEPAGGGYGGSKVESLGIRRIELEKELARKQAILERVDRALREAPLEKRERDLITYMAKGGSLSSFARARNIYKSHVYKIRDNALRKMAYCVK